MAVALRGATSAKTLLRASFAPLERMTTFAISRISIT
jgi:hypothetical protein